ncbi:MAG TPA: hypothetical protein VNM90_07575, partial [Haliangium sp.]|nr:hypothetical protein [Haliangium sp.]
MRRHAFPGIHAALSPHAARLLLLTSLCASASACGSDPGTEPLDAVPGPSPADARPRPGDAGLPADGTGVAHVPAAGAFAGTGRLILQDGAIIDTTNLTIDEQPYTGGPGAEI